MVGFVAGGKGLARDGFGGVGANVVGILGAEADRIGSGSEEFTESLLAPVSTPAAVLRSFGIPPAKIPPNCGAPVPAVVSPPLLLGASLLPLARLVFPGTGGAIPGTGGAPPAGGPPDPPNSFPRRGAERSFVTAFFSLFPLLMSPRRASCGQR